MRRRRLPAAEVDAVLEPVRVSGRPAHAIGDGVRFAKESGVPTRWLKVALWNWRNTRWTSSSQRAPGFWAHGGTSGRGSAIGWTGTAPLRETRTWPTSWT